ncbi:hypothetical protein OAA99_01945 [Omnitrophica bacterium]|nr:hypothetical protein [Candidatus Omnitrophota bacterium]
MKKTFLISVAILALFGGAVLIINPAFADIIYAEGNFVENLAVIICSTALIFSSILFLTRYKKRSGYGFWLFLSVLLFVFVGDDISWGMNYLWFTKPRIAGVGFDGIHDAFSIIVSTVKLVRDYIKSVGLFDIRSIAIIVGSALAIPTAIYSLIKLIVKNKERIRGFFSKNLKWEPFLFFFVGVIMLILAVVIDDDNLIGFPHKAVVEESIELLAAASFLFSCIAGFREKRDV